ncbi:hypothetical protein [Austwickia sp. TVS 96-490-7B]|uniref:hypothetical protein n=1 Tax=Austwickia sp. TVS 96-490-7B TaxID=2830843 RepID=UPI001C5611CB|nr:hypothetical protein [Austwickia sp. TVS 96-490-7B]
MTNTNVTRGEEATYRLVPLTEPTLPSRSDSFGRFVADNGTLMADSRGPYSGDDTVTPPLPDDSKVYLANQSTGVTMLPIMSIDCNPEVAFFSWKALGILRDGSIRASTVCRDGGSALFSSNTVMRWGTPKEMPRNVPLASSLETSFATLDINNDGQIMNSAYEEPHFKTIVVKDGHHQQEIHAVNSDQEVYGIDIGDDGTVVGNFIRQEPARFHRFPEPGMTQLPFVAEKGSAIATPLSLPPGTATSNDIESPNILQVSPDGRWIIGSYGPRTVAWDSQRHPVILSDDAHIVPVKILSAHQALVTSAWGPAILDRNIAHPLSVKDLPQGSQLVSVSHVNSSLQIAATIRTGEGRRRAVLLAPSH